MALTKKIISILFIMLIVMIPVNTAMIFGYAGTLDEVEYHGQDDIQGFVRSSADPLEISVLARMLDNDDLPIPVNPSNVRYSIEGAAYQEFDSCSAEGNNWYRCIYTGNSRDWSPQKRSFDVKLYDDTSIRLDEYSNSLYVDVYGPTINYASFPKSVRNEDMQVNFSVTDTACNTCGSSCIGLDRLEIYSKGDLKYTYENLSGCSLDDNLTVAAAALNLDEGDNNVCLRAYDKGELYGEDCDDVFVDYNAPELVAGTFGIYDEQGNLIEYSSSLIIVGDVKINITESTSGISKENVRANFSELYPPMAASYGNIAASSCTQDNNTYECVWENINIKNTEVDKVDIEFNVRDDAGNLVTQTITQNMPLDQEKPVVLKLTTKNGMYLNRTKNVIVAEIAEGGSGVAQAQMSVDLHNVLSSYGISKDADECEEIEGTWYCYWYDITAEDRDSGETVTIFTSSLKDDAGNSYNPEDGTPTAVLVYDNEEPIVANVTLKPFGSDLGVLMEGDVVEITAYVQDLHSGISAERVYADYSDIDPTQTWTEADSCEMVENTIYKCVWEYSGTLIPDSFINLDVRVTDNAGNTVTEDDAGAVYVAEVDETVVDFWQENAGGEASQKLNPNFIWMSSSGTIVRANMYLVSKSGDPYVHGFDIKECKGRLVAPSAEENVSEDFVDYSIVNQFYYPGTKEAKYALINIPNYQKDNVPDGGVVEIICAGEVVQGRTSTGAIYRPNELVNTTVDVQLMSGLFQQPSSSSLYKIREGRGTIKQLDQVITIITGIDTWLNPLCTAINSIRGILNSLCGMFTALKALVTWGSSTATGYQCSNTGGMLEQIWYGEKEGSSKGQGNAFEQEDGLGTLGNSKNLMSLGFWCDLVLCEECGNQWNNGFGFMDESINSHLTDMTTSWMGDFGANENDYDNSDHGEYSGGVASAGEMNLAAFDPHRSLPVALICMPPCLSGIKNNAVIYKQILVDYNVCLNVAAVRGYGAGECEAFKSSQTCQQVVGWFWSFVEGFITQWITGVVMYFANEWILSPPGCPPRATGMPDGPYVALCMIPIASAVMGFFLTVEEIYEKVMGLADLGESFKDEKDVQSDIDEELEDGEEDSFGNYPSY